MTSTCIHGFLAAQCAACRTCAHGLTASRCGRCASAATARSTRVKPAAAPGRPVVEHRGFEIYYVPELSGWQFRAPDSGPSPLSYRSTFLARKAIDEIAPAAEGNDAGSPASKPS